MAEEEPSEMSNPKKTLTPRNAGESLPGRYGKTRMKANAYTITRSRLKVGMAHSR